MEKNMKKIHRILVIVGIVGLSLTAGTTFASAQMKPWEIRSVEVIKEEIETNKQNGMNSYTVQWGDTLYSIAQASGLTVSQLVEMNTIPNAGAIDVGMTVYFGEQGVDSNVLELLVEDASQENGDDVYYKMSPYVDQEVAENSELEIEPAVEDAQEITSPKLYGLSQFMFDGVIRWNGLKFTYYSQQVLPGGGLRIPGRHVNADGYVADGDGYIVVANDAPLGTIIDTPFGYKGKVYDRGTVGNHFDVYIR